jgi:predicted double-glycine peptidase
MAQLPHTMFGLEAFLLRNAYLRCIGEQLWDALNNTGRLGTIYEGLTNYIFAKNNGAQIIPRITKQACVQSLSLAHSFY